MKGFSLGWLALGLGLFISSFFLSLFQPDLICDFRRRTNSKKKKKTTKKKRMKKKWKQEKTVKTNDQKKEENPTCDNDLQ